MLDAGAVLVQVYSGFIYAGPRFVGDILDLSEYFYPHIPTLSQDFQKPKFLPYQIFRYNLDVEIPILATKLFIPKLEQF